MPTVSDYLSIVSGSYLAPQVAKFVRLVNNSTGTAYVSAAATDSTGLWTISNIPAGVYTVYYGPLASGPWTAAGDNAYEVGASPDDTNTWTAAQTYVAAAGSNQTISSRITGDTNDRVRVRGDGTIFWGNGAGTLDVNLSRPGNNRMQLSGADLEVARQVYPGAEALGAQTSGGFLHAAGVPSGANGNNNDWIISDNGRIYFKSGGAWTTPLAAVQTQSPAVTLYVDQGAGSDSNDGKSEGTALQTLAAAALKLNQGGVAGEIVFVSVQGGFIPISAPIHFTVAAVLRAKSPWGASIQRTFSTPNSRSVWDAVTTAGGTSVQSSSAVFTSADTNRIAMIYGAGTGGGTYYGYLTFTDSTHCDLSSLGTAVARNATTDPKGVKMTICGDWNRQVLDAGITAGQSVVTSGTAAWTTADIGTELVIEGCGHNGQALRSVIKSVNPGANTATILGVATFTVSSRRCSIGVNFGHALCWHASGGGTRYLAIQDTTSGNGTIGAALALYMDEGAAAIGSASFEFTEVTSGDAAGAWEHTIDFDGSWNQAAGGTGIRSVQFVGQACFGARRALENIRFNTVVHAWFIGGEMVESPVSIRQGVLLLDPLRNGGGRGTNATEDIYFVGFHAIGDYYCEGDLCGIVGGRWGGASASGKTIQFTSSSSRCCVNTSDNQTTDTTYDQGANNLIITQLHVPQTSERRALVPTNSITYDTYNRVAASGASQTPTGWASGVGYYMSIWLPGGLLVSKVTLYGGGANITWGTGYTGQHFRIGLYDATGTLLGESADGGGSTLLSATPISLASAVTVPKSGLCWIGLLINGGTGGTGFAMPTLQGVSASTPLTSTPYLSLVQGSGLTDLPATITLTMGNVNQVVYGGIA